MAFDPITYAETRAFRAHFILLNGDPEAITTLLTTGLTPAGFATWLALEPSPAKFQQLISAPNGIAAVAASSTAMTAIIASSTAMTAIIASSTARTALDASSPVQIPTMTSTTAPSGVSAASTVNANAAYASWAAFDKNPATYWATADYAITNGWISYTFSSAVWVYSYSILISSANVTLNCTPKNISLQAFNGTAWITVDTRVALNVSTLQRFTVASPVSAKYTQWRLFCADEYGSPYGIAINELNMWGK